MRRAYDRHLARARYIVGAAVIGLAIAPVTLMAGGDESGMWAALRFASPQASKPAAPASAPPLGYAPQQNRLMLLPFEQRNTLRPLPRQPRQPAIASVTPQRTTLKQRLICTRLCDGDQLVLGFKGGIASDEEFASMCDAAGGSSQTALLSSELGNDSVTVEQYRGREPGKTYAAMSDFLAEERSRGVQACSPEIAEKPMSVPIEADATLEEGDIVATSGGFKVFVGDAGMRHHERSFVELERARGVPKNLRRMVQKLAAN